MTVKKIVLATVGAALVATTALPAFAAPDRPDRGPGGPMRHGAMQDIMFVRLLKTADTNKDGKISKEEFAAQQETLFAAADGNKDGSVTRGELLDYRIAKREEFRKNNPPPQMPDLDQDDEDDGDNAAPGPRADGPDNDRPRHEHAGRHHRDRDGDGFARHARWERHGERRMMGGGFFRMVDEDRDGKITKAETGAAGDKLFARMDTNKDNTISIDDLPDRPL